jgi:hypothetical protein
MKVKCCIESAIQVGQTLFHGRAGDSSPTTSSSAIKSAMKNENLSTADR